MIKSAFYVYLFNKINCICAYTHTHTIFERVWITVLSFDKKKERNLPD